MNHLLRRLPHPWLSRPLTEQDFFSICEQEGISVTWGRKAFYFTVLGHHFIQLPKAAQGLALLYPAFHELGHYYLSAGQPIAVAMFHGDSKDESECDTAALLALCPNIRDAEALLDLWPRRIARKLYNDRLRLHFLFGV